MAATVDFGLDAKQGLLDLRSENARLRLATRLFKAAMQAPGLRRARAGAGALQRQGPLRLTHPATWSSLAGAAISLRAMDGTPHRGMLGPGDELAGFVIEAVAGRGGMGVVYRARQRQPDRLVALKIIAEAYAEDPAFRARFQRESSIAAQIEHPNVIPVHAVGEADGVLYLVMRFVEGTDMRAVIAQEGRLEPRRAATIVDAVGQALDAAHSNGLVHRDVKPANILLSTAGGREHVYLSDFGLSRHIEGSQGLTGTGAFLGTIDYVAPEQARGEHVDARTDVYSLGCVLFQALTGTVPFPRDNDIAKLYAHDRSPPPSVLERVGDVPAAFEAVLARAMAKAPDDRYLSAGDLGRAAVAAASGTTLSRSERNVAVGPRAAPSDIRPVPAAPPPPRACPSREPEPRAPTPARRARPLVRGRPPRRAARRPSPRTRRRSRPPRGARGGAGTSSARASSRSRCSSPCWWSRAAATTARRTPAARHRARRSRRTTSSRTPRSRTTRRAGTPPTPDSRARPYRTRPTARTSYG